MDFGTGILRFMVIGELFGHTSFSRFIDGMSQGEMRKGYN
jgi:hypothetical protein